MLFMLFYFLFLYNIASIITKCTYIRIFMYHIIIKIFLRAIFPVSELPWHIDRFYDFFGHFLKFIQQALPFHDESQQTVLMLIEIFFSGQSQSSLKYFHEKNLLDFKQTLIVLKTIFPVKAFNRRPIEFNYFWQKIRKHFSTISVLNYRHFLYSS